LLCAPRAPLALRTFLAALFFAPRVPLLLQVKSLVRAKARMDIPVIVPLSLAKQFPTIYIPCKPTVKDLDKTKLMMLMPYAPSKAKGTQETTFLTNCNLIF
jgi:hypothetical protein